MMPLPSKSSSSVRALNARRAFTLTELLIVIGIIVLVLAMALPAFNAITGGKSVESAVNNIASFLGRARAEAVALQRETGVFFYIDPVSQRRTMAIVRKVDYTNAPGYTYFEIADAVDVMTLPDGIDVQTVDTSGASTAGPYERYVGFTKLKIANEVRAGGMIVFDGNGYLTQRKYSLRCAGTETGKFIYSAEYVQANPTLVTDVGTGLNSQVGVVVFQTAAFAGRNFTLGDARLSYAGDADTGTMRSYTANGTASELNEEKWIDANATPILINRFNGTLVRYAER